MKDISVKAYGLSAICRLCLKCDITLTDIFRFSSKLNEKVADVIMQCAPVQIARHDNLPNFICQLCCTQLENIHQFQMQVVNADNTLRRYLQQLHVSDKKVKLDCSIQSRSDGPVIQNINPDITMKSKYSEHQEVFDMDMNWKDKLCVNLNPAKKINNEIALELQIKSESIDDKDPLFLRDYGYDTIETLSNCDASEIRSEDLNIDIGDTKVGIAMDIKWNEKESPLVNSKNEINEGSSLNSKIKHESNDDSPLIDDAVNSSFNDDGLEIIWAGIKTDAGHTLANFVNLRSADVTRYFDECEEKNKSVSIHFEKHKKPTEKECNVCNARFARLRDFQTHKRIHCGAKSHQCGVCQKCFTHVNTLKVHERTHTGEKPYQCNVCKKRFNQLAILSTHMFIHTGMKPYRCEFCKKDFITSSELRKHNRTHTGEKPYQCDVCQKSFTTGNSLKKHKYIHTGEKPYKCHLCEKSYCDVRYLKYHQRVHTGETPYQCPLCEKSFYDARNLRDHKRCVKSNFFR